jgi:hypothetical protein
MGLLSSSSKSSSSTSSVTQDNRVVADAEAQAANTGGINAKDHASPVNVVISNSLNKSSASNYVNVTTTDFGAIKLGLEFAEKAMDRTGETVEEVLGIAKSNFDQTTNALQAAYEDAKGGTLVMQRVAYAALATVAVGLYFWLGKGKK